MKNKKIRKIFNLIVAALCLPLVAITTSLTGCGNSQSKSIKNIKIEHGKTYGGIDFLLSDSEKENFLNTFKLGDSLKMQIKNTNNEIVKEINDIPFYNGYYGETGSLVIVAYVNSPIRLSIVSYEEKFWNEWKLDKTMTIDISLNQSQKYIDTQNALNFSMITEKGTMSDEDFANFRPINTSLTDGKMKENKFFRGFSPCNDKYQRSTTVNSLIEKHQITYDINLSDTEQKLEQLVSKEDFAQKYKYFYDNIYLTKNYVTLGMMPWPYSDTVRCEIKTVCEKIIEQGTDKNYYFHCIEGKDRTGMVCVLIEALCGANYDYIKADYLQSYVNEFNADFTNEKTLNEATRVFFIANNMAPIFYPEDLNVKTHTEQDFKDLNLEECAANYMKNYIKLTDSQITSLKEVLCK